MEFSVLALLFALAGLLAVALERVLATAGLFTGRLRRFPRRLSLQGLAGAPVPASAQAPADFLGACLGRMGFDPAPGGPMRLREPRGFGREVYLMPFVHRRERALFLLAVDSGLLRRSELMLHIITPLVSDRRVETTTLIALNTLRPPSPVQLQVIVDADSVEEIWSRHRRALMEYSRAERMTVEPDQWSSLAERVYENWLAGAVRAQRLRLSQDGRSYRLRTRDD